MRSERRQFLQWGTVVLTLGVHELLHGATLLAVRVWPAAEYSRVTLESDVPLKARQTLVPSPPRLAVDIEGLELNPALRELVGKVRADDPNIAGVRVGQYSPGVVRLVFDLKQPISPQVFTLPPVAAYQHRLVFDLYPSTPPDPLEQLIADRLGNAQPPAPAGDPLGDLIARQGQGTRRLDMQPPSGPVMDTPDHPPRAQAGTDRLIVVALDPGHGGEDPGAIGPGGTREKDVVLRIAHKLRERINTTQVGGSPMRAFLTREADYFVPLQVRVQKARRVQADLFVSIHADAFFTPEARGASVFAARARHPAALRAGWRKKKTRQI